MRKCLILFVAVSSLLSCTDRGEVVEYLEIVSIDPTPGAIGVDKARSITIRLDRPVHISQTNKIRVNYLNDSTSSKSVSGCGFTPPEVEFLCTGPFIWVPGKTVEVFIPQEVSDSQGRTLRAPFSYRFTIADDVAPFQVVDSEPQAGDTVSIGPGSFFYGHITFSDYLPIPDSLLTITSPAGITVFERFVSDGRSSPSRVLYFLLEHLQADTSYRIMVSGEVKDFEGEELSDDYDLEFHTKL